MQILPKLQLSILLSYLVYSIIFYTLQMIGINNLVTDRKHPSVLVLNQELKMKSLPSHCGEMNHKNKYINNHSNYTLNSILRLDSSSRSPREARVYIEYIARTLAFDS